MMLLSLVLLQVIAVWQLSSAQSPLLRSRHSYPSPRRSPRLCNRQSPSYFCDPDGIIVSVEANQLNALLERTKSETHCPCSRYSCLQYEEGYKIGIALTKKIRPDVEFESLSDDERDEETRRTEWTLNEGKLFAHELLDKWDMGRCKEDVIIFYSVMDGVLYTAAGDVARMKLNHTVIRDIAMNARGDFGLGGNIFKGLLKIVTEYRSVFFGAYNSHDRPTASEVRSAGPSSIDWNLIRIVPTLLASLVVIALTCLAS